MHFLDGEGEILGLVEGELLGRKFTQDVFFDQ
jgi:hypothetical protein